MKRFGIAVLFVLCFAIPAFGQVVWQEDFDRITEEYVCCRNDCGGGLGFSERHANAMCGGDGCNMLITSAADRLGKSNGKGMRIKFTANCFPTGENVLKKDLGENVQTFYLRWYEKNTINRFSNFHKLYRLKQSSGQILIPEWQLNGGNVQMNLGIPYPTSGSTQNFFFTGYNLNTNYTPGTWACYELFIDIPNRQSEFWVNGVSKGKLTNLPINTSWYVRNVEIGGNQYGGGVGNYRDYDDIVISKSYIGPSGTTPPPACVPLPTESRTVSCAAGYSGAIVEQRISTCPGPTWGQWTVVSNTCAVLPEPEKKCLRFVPCEEAHDFTPAK